MLAYSRRERKMKDGVHVMTLPDFLESNIDGEICLRGHRIRLIDIAARYDEGHSAEAIAIDDYPTLSLPLITRPSHSIWRMKRRSARSCAKMKMRCSAWRRRRRPRRTLLNCADEWQIADRPRHHRFWRSALYLMSTFVDALTSPFSEITLVADL
jgi:hypothetical protein